MKQLFKIISYASIPTIIFLIDRLTKLWALSLSDEMVVNRFLSFDLVFNRGISWGLFNTQQSSWIVLLPVMIITVGLLYYTFQRFKQKKCILGEILVIVGSCSNIIDRLQYDAVIDFIQVHYQHWYFPVFNIADMSIVCGIFFMVLMHWQRPSTNLG